MATLQIQARALGDPTRHAIFRYLVDADRPVGVAELTAHLQLNHNAIRQHLTKLVDAGLVLESVAPAKGRGRPRLDYIIDPATDARWGTVAPYERLAVLLADMVRSGETPIETGRRAGRARVMDEANSAPIASRSNDPVGGLVDQMARLGFDPAVREKAGTVELILQTCPFVAAVVTDPDTVCDLHLGLAQGVAEAIGGLHVDDLVRKDPHRANCRLRCRVIPGPSAVEQLGAGEG